MKQTRSGIGYDVHRLVEGRRLVLGGVHIPFELGLSGHSDADVLSHAIADAVLGAIGEADIGFHFPPDDPDCEGIDSMRILEKAAELVDGKGGATVNIDSTLVAEVPKILPFAGEMKAKIAAALGIDVTRVGVKATTNERLGFLGREEGMAAMAVASVELPAGDAAG